MIDAMLIINVLLSFIAKNGGFKNFLSFKYTIVIQKSVEKFKKDKQKYSKINLNSAQLKRRKRRVCIIDTRS
jgi:hypothetical protein